MFKVFKREFEAQPRFAVGDLVFAKYDISNGNGVFTRGSILKITKYKIGSYCQGISYNLEDSVGNIVAGVDEAMLAHQNDTESSRFRCFIKRMKGDSIATANLEEVETFDSDESSIESSKENGRKKAKEWASTTTVDLSKGSTFDELMKDAGFTKPEKAKVSKNTSNKKKRRKKAKRRK